MSTRCGEIQEWLCKAVNYDGYACLVWPFSVSSSGYGDFRQNKQHFTSHRFVCESVHGTAPANADAAHSCHNKLCCNPNHLRWASRAENLEDRREAGTIPLGERMWNAKLTEADIPLARDTRLSQAAAASILGVSASAIQAVRDGRTWKHVK